MGARFLQRGRKTWPVSGDGPGDLLLGIYPALSEASSDAWSLSGELSLNFLASCPRMGVLNRTDFEVDDYSPFLSLLVLDSYLSWWGGMGTSCSRRARGGGDCVCSESCRLSVLLLLQESLFSSPIRKGKNPELVEPSFNLL